MSYGNDYSNKPFERASKTSHTNIINDTTVQSFLSKCKMPPYHEEIDDKDIELLMLEEPTKNPIKNIITIDGGYTNVFVKEDFPSSTIAFFQFGALFFKHQDLLDLKEKPFIDPEDFSKLQNIQRIKLVVPTKGIALDGEIDFVSSVRRTIYEFFISQPERNGFMDALKWLIFEEYSSSDNSKIWHLATCPHCSIGVDIQRKNVQNDYTITCPHCGGKIYLTDILRLHEVIDNELGAGGILGYLTTAVEQIIIVYLIKQMLNIRPSLLSQTLFVKDGPLAFFGQTANLHKPMRKLMTFLNQNHSIYLVGLEKSGSFVEHAVQASKKMLPKQMLLLGNSYIYKYIIPGNGRDSEPYAISSYYGHKVIFKSEHNNVYVATIPNVQAMVEPQISDYININEILYNITALKCDLYYNSLVPVVMANKLVSLADHPSSDLLKTFAQEKIIQ
ncbi:DNA double-strand break repair nuclease NurA [Acutalibacter muris]|uniref:DNA double-strand break repair nuclease NurA n=1 Tax=Acutalibacter muris TaxID=1796620 RepID=UPI001C3EE511|nr:DNA double-strand break repair nuclease NurA [Acutalibacter muris]